FASTRSSSASGPGRRGVGRDAYTNGIARSAASISRGSVLVSASSVKSRAFAGSRASACGNRVLSGARLARRVATVGARARSRVDSGFGALRGVGASGSPERAARYVAPSATPNTRRSQLLRGLVRGGRGVRSFTTDEFGTPRRRAQALRSASVEARAEVRRRLDPVGAVDETVAPGRQAARVEVVGDVEGLKAVAVAGPRPAEIADALLLGELHDRILVDLLARAVIGRELADDERRRVVAEEGREVAAHGVALSVHVVHVHGEHEVLLGVRFPDRGAAAVDRKST